MELMANQIQKTSKVEDKAKETAQNEANFFLKNFK